MSTSEPVAEPHESGFSLVEVLVTVVIGLLLALAVAALWSGLQSAGARAADRVTLAGQSRVAVARLERDLRTASADPAGRAGGALLLRARSEEVVFLVPTGSGLEVVEWEVAGRSLMRRRGTWAGQDPASVSHSWYSDHKTQLSGVLPGTGFAFFVLGAERAAVEDEQDRAVVEAVRLRGALSVEGAAGPVVDLRSYALVGG